MPSNVQLWEEEAIRRALDLDAFAEEERQRVRSLLRRIEQELAGELVGGDYAPHAELSQGWRERRMQRLLEQVRATLRERYGEIARSTSRNLAELYSEEAGQAVDLVRRLLPPPRLVRFQLAPAQVRQLVGDTLIRMGDTGARPIADWWRRQESDLYNQFQQRLQRGFLEGEGVDELRRRIFGRINRREGISEGGIMDVRRSHADTLVRTSVNQISGDARRETFQKNGVRGIRQISTLDERTTPICIARHKKVWVFKEGQLIPQGHDISYNGGIPVHPNCRSAEIAYHPDHDPSDLAEDSDDFLRRMDKEGKLGDVLGTGRASLWRNGKISTRDLLDRRGQVRRLTDITKGKQAL